MDETNSHRLRHPPRLYVYKEHEWDLSSLALFQETDVPYHTDLPTPDEICQLLQLERIESNRNIKSKNVILLPNQILTKELRQDMKRWEELIRENVFGLGGYRDHLPACLAHMLYCIVAKEQYNLAYFFAKKIVNARATPTANLPYGMFLTRLYRHVMESYPYLNNGIYNVVDRVRIYQKSQENSQKRASTDTRIRRVQKSDQKPEAKPGKVKPSVKVVKSWSTKVNKAQNMDKRRQGPFVS
ncbi:hypothetical protein Tco_0158468 [Tanacetum coccineum]